MKELIGRIKLDRIITLFLSKIYHVPHVHGDDYCYAEEDIFSSSTIIVFVTDSYQKIMLMDIGAIEMSINCIYTRYIHECIIQYINIDLEYLVFYNGINMTFDVYEEINR